MIDVLQKITLQRTARNWTEYQLAVRSGLPQSTISSWYRKNMLPSLSSLEKICTAFDMLHIPQELRIRSRGTERHSASN